MKQAEKIVLDLLGRALFAAPTVLPEDVDWEDVYRESMAQAVFLLVLNTLTKDEMQSMPENIKRQWWQNAMQALYQNEQLLFEQRHVISLLDKQNIPCAILKGSSAAIRYPDPSLRLMGDIDILVLPEQQMQAVEFLQADGYGEVLMEEHHCHMSISKGNIRVEVHKEPNGLHVNKDEKVGERLRNFFADAVPNRHYEEELPILSDRHQAGVLIIHKLEHFLSGGLGLRQLCDWAAFVHARMTAELWQELKPQFKEMGVLYFTGIITRVCVDYLHLPESSAPWAMEYDAHLAQEVMEKILEAGNFGIKDRRYGQHYFVDVHSSNRITSFLNHLGPMCRHHWPACEKYPILMPIAPFVAFAKYLKLRRKGERPALHPIELYKNSGAKQRLYHELKPFITED